MINRKDLIRFFKYLKPFWLENTIGFIIIMVLAGITLPIPLLFKAIIDRALVDKNLSYLIYLIALIIVLMFIKQLLGFCEILLFSNIRKKVFSNIRFSLYCHLQKMSMSFYKDKQSGKLLSRILNDVSAMQNLFADIFLMLARDIILGIIVLVIMLKIHFKIVLISCLFIPLFYLIYGVFGKKIYEASKTIQEKQESLSGLLQEDIAGIKIIQSFSSEKHKNQKAYAQILGTEDKIRAQIIINSLADFLASAINMFGLVLLWGYGGYEVIKGNLTIGTLIAISYYFNYLAAPIINIFSLNIDIQSSLAAVRRVFEILENEPEIKDQEKSKKLQALKGDIKFQNVVFAYNRGKPVLNKINLSINSGSIIGVVGRSGVGKSTFINLLSRFYDPESGAIYIDGHNIKTIKLSSLRKAIGIVEQDIFLFNATIKENILLGKNSVDTEQLISAMQMANAYEFIQNLPQGLETIVGERGLILSGGQKQRLSIARALIYNPKILIFDEATSEQDLFSEQIIYKTIQNIKHEKTIFIVTHRLSNLSIADQIIVLENGEIREKGNHIELISRKGIYQELHSKQFTTYSSKTKIA